MKNIRASNYAKYQLTIDGKKKNESDFPQEVRTILCLIIM